MKIEKWVIVLAVIAGMAAAVLSWAVTDALRQGDMSTPAYTGVEAEHE